MLDLERLSRSGRPLSVRLVWGCVVAAVFWGGTGHWISGLIVVSIFLLLPYLQSIAATRTPRNRPVIVEVDTDGVLRVIELTWQRKWHRWQWCYQSRKDLTVVVLRWPWCVLSAYCVFPVTLLRADDSPTAPE